MHIQVKYGVTNPRIKKLCNEALQSKLNLGWRGLMRSWCLYPDNVAIIAIAYLENEPIGCGMITSSTFYNIGVYVKPSYRRNGIGTKILKVLQKRDKSKWLCDTTTKEAKKLYGKTGKKRQETQNS